MNAQIQFSKEIVSNKETAHEIQFNLSHGHIYHIIFSMAKMIRMQLV